MKSTHLPQGIVDRDPIIRLIRQSGELEEYSIGKLRHTFMIPETDFLFVVTTDRLSIFDFVLSALIPGKGAVLTKLTVFWLTQIFHWLPHQLAAWGSGIDEYLPDQLRGIEELHQNGIVVKKLKMLPIECVVRWNLVGSSVREYQETGKVFGHPMPPGLVEYGELPFPVFTPTTKALEGHDEAFNINNSKSSILIRYERLALQMLILAQKHCHSHGKIVADTKFEFGVEEGSSFESGPVFVADEVLTPDSSRFWNIEEYKEFIKEGTPPSSQDKDVVRKWGNTVSAPFRNEQGNPIVGIQNLNPDLREHREFVYSLTIPEDVVKETTRCYKLIHDCLIG